MPIGAGSWWTDATPETARLPEYEWRDPQLLPLFYMFAGFGHLTPPFTGYAWSGPGYYGFGGTGIGSLRGGSN